MGKADLVRLGSREIRALVELMRETKLYVVLEFRAREKGVRLEDLLVPERMDEFRELVVEMLSEDIYNLLVRTALRKLKK